MTKYFDASSVQGNADEVFRFMKFAQFPSFSRLFPEAFDRHLKSKVRQERKLCPGRSC